MTNDCRPTIINVNKQSTKNFKDYTRSIIYLHKRVTSPPEYLMVDLKCDGAPKKAVRGQAYLIIWY